MLKLKHCLAPLLTLLCLFALFACSSPTTTSGTGLMYMRMNSTKDVDTTNLQELEDLSIPARKSTSKQQKTEKPNPIRAEGLKESAMSIGAQGALAGRSEDIDQMLEKNRIGLDQVFNFYPLILPHNVLPPVLVEGRHILNVADNDTIRIADQSYTILQQARFATAPPNWRQYLWLSYSKPDASEIGILPNENNPQEIALWKEYVDLGWKKGTEQANTIFSENLSRLRRDYQGMTLYKKLLDEQMISAPIIAKTELGVTGGGGEMSINDQFLRITAHPSLNQRSEEWKPAVAQTITSFTATVPETNEDQAAGKDGIPWRQTEAEMHMQRENAQ